MIIDPQYTKNLVLDLNNGNKVSPSDNSLVIIKRPTFALPLMPNREVRVHTNFNEGKYINGLFNKHTVNSHLGLSFDNILNEMIRTNSYTWVLNFSRFGRDLTKYIDFSYIHFDNQVYTSFNFLTNHTINLIGSALYATIDSVAKTLTFQRVSLQFTKASVGYRLPAVAIRMMFKVPTKMVVLESTFDNAVEEAMDISILTSSKIINTTIEGTTVQYKSIPLDIKLSKITSYENFDGTPYEDRYLEEFYYDESGILDSFKDSSKKNTGTNLHTSAPRWHLIKEGHNHDLPSYSKDIIGEDYLNVVDLLNFDSNNGLLTSYITTNLGNPVNISLCGLVMIFPVNDAVEYTNLPSNPSPIGTANFYIQAQTEYYLMYSYTFSRQHKIGSIPYISLLNDTEYIRLNNLDGDSPVDRNFVLNVGSTYNFYVFSPYSVTLVHNNRNANTVLRVLDNVLPSIASQTKYVGGGNATFLGYYSSSTGGTQYINSSRNWVLTPSPGQTLYARWSKDLIFSIDTRSVYKGKNSIEVNRNFVPDNAYLSGSQSLYYYTSQSGASGASISRSLKGSLILGSNASYQNAVTYNLSGGYQWYSYSNRFYLKANIKDTISYMSLVGNTLLTVPSAPCSLTKDETNGYAPAKNCILKTEVNEVSPGVYEFKLLASNPNNYNVKLDYIIYSYEGIVSKSGTTIVPSGPTSTLLSYSVVDATYGYQVVTTQSWDSNAGNNAGKDSVYETVIESYNFGAALKTATPTVGTPYCESEGDYNYLRVSVTNNDSVVAVIKRDSVVLGNLNPGQTNTFVLFSGFNAYPSYNYNVNISATATDKTQSDSVNKSGSLNICYAV